MKLYCIINPQAGRGITAKLWPMIEKNLQKLMVQLEFVFTQYPGQAKDLAQAAIENDYNGVIAIGGDGTINEVINGLVGSQIPLGIVPTGTGNDLSKSLRIPQDPLEAIIVIAKGNKLEINLGEINGTYFANVASVGFDAAVANWVNKNKIFKGKAAYYSAIFYNIIKNKHYQLTINLDSHSIEKECTLTAIANGNYYGAGQMIAPRAVINDGFFDVVVVSAVSRGEILKTLPDIKEGKHIANPHVAIYKAREVTISSKEKHVPIQADGERIVGLPQTFRISDNKLKVFVP
ncbi:MAG: diacylglycerol/lipid kinase family protein [Bacillota bacterium]